MDLDPNRINIFFHIGITMLRFFDYKNPSNSSRAELLLLVSTRVSMNYLELYLNESSDRDLADTMDYFKALIKRYLSENEDIDLIDDIDFFINQRLKFYLDETRKMDNDEKYRNGKMYYQIFNSPLVTTSQQWGNDLDLFQFNLHFMEMLKTVDHITLNTNNDN